MVAPALLVALLLVAVVSGETQDSCAGPIAQLLSTDDSDPVFGVFAAFGRTLGLNESVRGHVALANPRDACLQLGEEARGSLLLVERGGCSFTDKAAAAQATGAAGMLLYDNVSGCITMGYGNKSDVEKIKIPCVSISQASGLSLEIAVSKAPSGTHLTLVLVRAHLPPVDPSALLLCARSLEAHSGVATTTCVQNSLARHLVQHPHEMQRCHLSTSP
ncbi:hypothetical protein FOA52_015778 [Chlamydomonas sp. UWO 241]|nr:hypothetical protein FOA52_015778 [Chlamydomonas sp. UWO 241]